MIKIIFINLKFILLKLLKLKIIGKNNNNCPLNIFKINYKKNIIRRKPTE